MNPTYLKSLAPALGVLALVVVFRASDPPAKQPIPAEFCHILHDCGSTQLLKPDSVENVRNVVGRTHADLNDKHLGDLFTYAQTRP